MQSEIAALIPIAELARNDNLSDFKFSKMWLKLEKSLFYLSVFCLFFQIRLILWPSGQIFNEWTSIYFYATDILILALIFLWVLRIWRFQRRGFSLSIAHAPTLKTLVWGHASPITTDDRRDAGLRSKFRCRGDNDFLKYLKSPLTIFLLMSALSIFPAQNKILGIYGFLKLAEFIGLFLYARANFLKYYQLEKFWQIFVAAASVQSAVAIGQFFYQKSWGLKYFESPLAINLDGVAKILVNGEKIIRAYGLVPHPNILAAILAVALFGLVYLWLLRSSSPQMRGGQGEELSTSSPNPSSTEEGRKKIVILGFKFLYSLAFLLISAALFFTFSRLITIVGLAALIIWLIFLWRRKADKKAVSIIFYLLLVVNCSLLIVCWPLVSSRYTFSEPGNQQSMDLRLTYAQTAWSMIKEQPLLGAGPGNFVLTLRSYFPSSPAWFFQPVHNIYLLIAAETGILGLLAFLWFLFLTVRKAWRHQNFETNCFLLIVICLLVFGLADHFLWDIQPGQIVFWLFLGILASISSHPINSNENQRV